MLRSSHPEGKKQKEKAVQEAQNRAEQKKKDIAKAKDDAAKAKEKAFKDKQLKVCVCFLKDTPPPPPHSILNRERKNGEGGFVDVLLSVLMIDVRSVCAWSRLLTPYPPSRVIMPVFCLVISHTLNSLHMGYMLIISTRFFSLLSLPPISARSNPRGGSRDVERTLDGNWHGRGGGNAVEAGGGG